jgi:hypothetical protein
MRMSASRIRSINRAIARVQSTVWTASRKNSHQPNNPSTMPAAMMTGTVKVVAVPRATAS